MDHHAKGQGEHSEVDLVQTDTKVSDDPGCNGGCDDPGNESQGYGRIDMEQHEAGDIGPDAEEGSVPKGKKPCIPKRRLKLMAKRIIISISVRKTMRKLDRNSVLKLTK